MLQIIAGSIFCHQFPNLMRSIFGNQVAKLFFGALNLGEPFLDFSDLKDQKKDEYFAAVRAGLEYDYKPMEKIFNDVIYRSLKSYDDE